MVASRCSMHAMSTRITFVHLYCMVMVLILWPLPFAGQFFRDGVSIDVDAQFLLHSDIFIIATARPTGTA